MRDDFAAYLNTVYAEFVRDMIEMIPRLVAALIVIIAGLIVAAIAERVLRSLLVRIRFDLLLRRANIDQWLNRIGIRQSMNDFLPRLLYFLLLVLFARAAADTLQLSALAELIDALLAYLPKLFAGLLILLFGSAIAQFAGAAVTNAARNAGIDTARPIGAFVAAALFVIFVVTALGQLDIETDFIRLIAGALIAGFVLALSLSFGLGSKDVTRSILAGFYARKTFRVGEELEIAGERGILLAITPTQIILQQGEQLVALPNTTFLEQVARQ